MQLDMYETFEEAEKEASVLPSAPPDDINHKMAVLLEEFHKCGFITCFDAERIVHRGQAVVGEMKARGHQIDTTAVGIDGFLGYIYRGFVAGMKRVSKSARERYYATAHWKRTAFERKEIDGFQCVQCKSSEGLETHHWRYNLFAENVQRDLITLCRQCHETMHQDISGSKVHFPRYVDETLFERMIKGNDHNTDSDDSGEQGTSESNDTSGRAECEGCCGGHEDATGTTGPVIATSEPSCGVETTGREESGEAPF